MGTRTPREVTSRGRRRGRGRGALPDEGVGPSGGAIVHQRDLSLSQERLAVNPTPTQRRSPALPDDQPLGRRVDETGTHPVLEVQRGGHREEYQHQDERHLLLAHLVILVLCANHRRPRHVKAASVKTDKKDVLSVFAFLFFFSLSFDAVELMTRRTPLVFCSAEGARSDAAKQSRQQTKRSAAVRVTKRNGTPSLLVRSEACRSHLREKSPPPLPVAVPFTSASCQSPRFINLS